MLLSKINLPCKGQPRRNFRNSPNVGARCIVRALSIHDLRSWVDSEPGSSVKQLESFQAIGTGGNGLKALARIPKGQEVLAIPRSLFLDGDSARASLGDDLADQLPEWPLLTLHLLAERALGPQSRWAPYLATLPDQTLHPLCWPEDALHALLKGSPMLQTVQRLKGEARSNLQLMKDAGAAEALAARLGLSPAVIEGSVLTEPAVLWAAATLLSRAHYFNFTKDDFAMALAEADAAVEEDEEGAAALTIDAEALGEEDEDDIFGAADEEVDPSKELHLALVPWLDMMNHASEAPDAAEAKFDPRLNAAVVRAHRDFAVGDEVTYSYGPNRSCSELLVDYGFVDARNANYWIEVPLRELSRSGKRGNQRLIDTCLASIGEQEVTVVLDEGGPDATILSWLRTAHASLEDLQRAGWDVGIKLAPRGGFKGSAGPSASAVASASDPDPSEVAARALMVVSEFEEPAGPMTEVRALESLVALMDEKLKAYPTALEDDTAFVRARESTGASTSASLLPESYQGSEDWQRIEVFVRRALASEKRALEGTKSAGLKWMSMIKRGIPLRKVYRLRGKDRERAQQIAAEIVEEEEALKAQKAEQRKGGGGGSRKGGAAGKSRRS